MGSSHRLKTRRGCQSGFDVRCVCVCLSVTCVFMCVCVCLSCPQYLTYSITGLRALGSQVMFAAFLK